MFLFFSLRRAELPVGAPTSILMSKHVALNAFLAIGMTFVIITGGIDLSVGSIVGLCGMVAGGLILHGIDLHDRLHALVQHLRDHRDHARASASLIGAVNGLLITRLNVAPFIATLGTLYVARGAGAALLGRRDLPEPGRQPGLGTTGFAFLGAGTHPRHLPVSIWILIVLALGRGLSGALHAARPAHLRGRRQRARARRSRASASTG